MTDYTNKYYKDAKPEDTLKKIKGILEHLGIKTKEYLFDNQRLSYSCRIVLNNYGLESLNIGTNGKGMSVNFSLASGYAELMERLQNKFLANEAIRHSSKSESGIKLKFNFFPDEEIKLSSVDVFMKHLKQLFPNYNIERYKDYLKSDINTIEWISVPYACLSKNNCFIQDMPIVLARANSSTGLCAGNTPYEAILQGINEIFERYVLQCIYLDNIVPPSFPTDYFKDSEIYKRLEELKKQGYIYDIKDMSLGKGFPVVGLILTNTNNGTTIFHLGADLDPEIALERCFTETYQGIDSNVKFLDYSIIDHNCINNTTFRNNQYLKNLRTSSGYYPFYIFTDKPTYEFHYPIFNKGCNTMDDLKIVIDFLHTNNYDVLIRDNSFLGFNSYHVFIPGLSDQNFQLIDVFSEYCSVFKDNRDNIVSELDVKTWPLYNLKSNKNLPEFILNHYPDDNDLRLAPYQTSRHNTINKNLLLFLYAVKNEDYKNANKYFSLFMMQRNESGFPYEEYLSCAGNYIRHKSMDVATDSIRTILKYFYNEDVVNEIISDFDNPDDIMNNYRFPTCFECEKCPIANDCHYNDAVRFELLIQEIQEKNIINQNKLLQLFN